MRGEFSLSLTSDNAFLFSLQNTQNHAKSDSQMKLTVPEEVKLNCLAAIHDHIVKSYDRLRTEFAKLPIHEKNEVNLFATPFEGEEKRGVCVYVCVCERWRPFEKKRGKYYDCLCCSIFFFFIEGNGKTLKTNRGVVRPKGTQEIEIKNPKTTEENRRLKTRKEEKRTKRQDTTDY
jgi:hypothetical protein